MGKNWAKFGSWKESDCILNEIPSIEKLMILTKGKENAHKRHSRITKVFYIKKVVDPKKAFVLLDKTGL
jgi:hypothetical protein